MKKLLTFGEKIVKREDHGWLSRLEVIVAGHDQHSRSALTIRMSISNPTQSPRFSRGTRSQPNHAPIAKSINRRNCVLAGKDRKSSRQRASKTRNDRRWRGALSVHPLVQRPGGLMVVPMNMLVLHTTPHTAIRRSSVELSPNSRLARLWLAIRQSEKYRQCRVG